MAYSEADVAREDVMWTCHELKAIKPSNAGAGEQELQPVVLSARRTSSLSRLFCGDRDINGSIIDAEVVSRELNDERALSPIRLVEISSFSHP